MRIFRRSLVAAMAMGVATLAMGQSQAPWPTRQPIKLVAVFPPGGSVDQVARILAQPLSQVLGQAVIVENKGGASGSIGTAAVAAAPADGYTFAVVFDTHGVNPSLIPNLPFDSKKDIIRLKLELNHCDRKIVTQKELVLRISGEVTDRNASVEELQQAIDAIRQLRRDVANDRIVGERNVRDRWDRGSSRASPIERDVRDGVGAGTTHKRRGRGRGLVAGVALADPASTRSCDCKRSTATGRFRSGTPEPPREAPSPRP